MEYLHVIAPLVGVLLGGMLTGVAAIFKERKEQKRTIATALADLLEIRHRILALDAIITQIRGHVELPPEAIPLFRNYIDSISLNDGLDERYNNAVTLLAGIDPVLSFSLRSKNSLPRFLSMLRNIAIGSGADMKEFESIESTLRSAVAPNLNEAVTELARYLPSKIQIQVRQLITQTNEASPELSQLIENFKSLAAPKV